MTTKKYRMTTKTGVQIVFGFDAKNRLSEFLLEDDLEDIHFEWFMDHLPTTYEGLQKLAALPSVKVAEIQRDLSFDAFWNAYAYKVGDKKRTEKTWNALPEAEKSQALDAIKKYNFYLSQRPNMDRLYAETFLSQKRYQNEFK